MNRLITLCDRCKEYARCALSYDGDNCRRSRTVEPTNADRIRAMSDEELDKFLGEVQWDVANYCGDVTQKQKYPVPEQRGAWLNWLKQEVEQ